MPPSWKYVFGPVPSRRLGLSLGIDVIPSKLCTLDCVYCEVGRTDKRGIARKEYIPAADIVREVREAVEVHRGLDHLTISGSGEPTLNSALGRIIRDIKSFTSVPVAVLTNGTLLSLPEVRKDLADADVVSPSLDAASAGAFALVDRPHPRLRIDEIVRGLAIFRKEFRGEMWLEILFVRGMNDSDDEVRELKQAVDQIGPDRIHLNTVVRPPADPSALPVELGRMKQIREVFGERCEIIGTYTPKDAGEERSATQEEVLALLARRGMTVSGIVAALNIKEEKINAMLGDLLRDDRIRAFEFDDQKFYQTTEATNEKH